MSEQDYIGVVEAFSVEGKPMPVVGLQAPTACDHSETVYSCDMALRCPWCGIRLFLPGRLLALLPEDTIEQMYQCWRDAGRPEWWGSEGWRPYHLKTRILMQHPLYDKLGGIPVDPGRLEAWRAKWA